MGPGPYSMWVSMEDYRSWMRHIGGHYLGFLMDPHRVQIEIHPGPRLWTHTGSQVLPHTLVPGTASYPGPRDCFIPWSQGLLHTLVRGTASYPGPRDCLIPWSQGLLPTLVPSTASYPGPKYCLIPWSQVLPLLVPGPAHAGSKKSPKQKWVQTGLGMMILT